MTMASKASKSKTLTHDIRAATSIESLLPIVNAIDQEDLKNLLVDHVNAASEDEVERIHRCTSSILNIISDDAFRLVLSFMSMYEIANVCVLNQQVAEICTKYVTSNSLKEKWLLSIPFFRFMFDEKWLNVDQYVHWTECSKATLDALEPEGYPGDNRVIPAGPSDMFPIVFFLQQGYSVGEIPKLRGIDAEIQSLCMLFGWKIIKVIYAEAQLCSCSGDTEYPVHCCSEVGVQEYADLPLDDHEDAMNANLRGLNIKLWRYSNIALGPGPEPPLYATQAFSDHVSPWPWYGITAWRPPCDTDLWDVNRGLYIVGPSAAWRRDFLCKMEKLFV